MASREELVRMLHHIQYEIRHCMLIPEWRDDAPMLKEAIFLSFFVHARVLIHFFQNTRGRRDDVFSSDFGFPPVKLPLPADVNTRFGKDMMHITWKRLRHTPESKPWPIPETYSAIKPTANAFVDHVLGTFGPELPENEQALWRQLQDLLHKAEPPIIVRESGGMMSAYFRREGMI
jgi:hypothetical protein